MRLDEPRWWYAPPGDLRARLLTPVAHLYGWIAERRYRRAVPYRARPAVVCIGNFTAGGTGKTPLSLLIAEAAGARGLEPAFLTRGFGGRAAGPLRVEPGKTGAGLVGDEPLLLARVAPTVVARDRTAGIRAIEETLPATRLVIMDDGLQNGSLAKDLTIAVVDGMRGIGNGEVIPAGPLRAPIGFQLDLVDAIVVNGPPGQEEAPGSVLNRLRRQFQGPVLAATVAAAADTSWLGGTPVVAFAGIGHPERFFATLRDLGATVVAQHAFPDHHTYSATDSRRLVAEAARKQAILVTTEKDLVRLDATDTDVRTLAAATRALPIRLDFVERDLMRLMALVDGVIERPA